MLRETATGMPGKKLQSSGIRFSPLTSSFHRFQAFSEKKRNRLGKKTSRTGTPFCGTLQRHIVNDGYNSEMICETLDFMYQALPEEVQYL